MKRDMANNSEKVISAIVLKYYKSPVKNDPQVQRFLCARCLKMQNRTGGGYLDEMGRPKQICEDCAVERFKNDHGYKTFKEAYARRRRIFDVGYLFNEIILDTLLIEKKIQDINEYKNADEVFIRASKLYSHIFKTDDKIKLEEIDSQKKIEDIFRKKLVTVDIEKIFQDL